MDSVSFNQESQSLYLRVMKFFVLLPSENSGSHPDTCLGYQTGLAFGHFPKSSQFGAPEQSRGNSPQTWKAFLEDSLRANAEAF